MSSSATWSSTHATDTGARTRPLRPLRPSRVSNLGTTIGSSGVLLIVAFVAGLVLGLPILGWWLWPVRTSNALPSDLAPAYRDAYVAMAADSYALNGDLALAKARLSAWDEAESARILQGLLEAANEAGSTVQAKRLEQLAVDLELATVAQAPVSGAPVEGLEDSDAQPRTSGTSSGLLLVIGVVLVGGGLLVAGYTVFRRAEVGSLSTALSALRSKMVRVPRPRFDAPKPASAPSAVQDKEQAEMVTGRQPIATVDEPEHDDEEISLDEALILLAQEIDIEEQEEPAPDHHAAAAQVRSAAEPEVIRDDASMVGTYVTTYRHGCDEMFDTSFNLETDDGEFLGECGVGVAETIGDSTPEQACAMEIWLFDKGDIRTTTKLLVSDFALDDPEIREALAGRGDMVRASKGQSMRLETAGLELKADVINVQYGEGPDVPPHSFFQELTLELRVVRKD